MQNIDPQHSDPGSAGVFQQRPDSGWGTFAQVQNVVYATTKFLQSCVAADNANPNLSYNDLCQTVQGSGFPNAYGQWRPEAENWVSAYLLTPPENRPKIPDLVAGITAAVDPAIGAPSGHPSPTKGMDGFFYRGIPGEDNKDWGKEDSWTCIHRLADEVNWRAFFKGGVFWYIDDFHLFEQKPIMNITESSKGIDSISFDYDRGKKLGLVTIKCRVGRWIAQPGDVIQIQNCGPINGKWLVNEYERSLFDLTATIVVKKPLPRLPEPKDEGVGAPPSTTTPIPPTPGGGTQPQPPVVSTTSIVLPPHIDAKDVSRMHCTDGLSGYPAVDFTLNADGETVEGTGGLGLSVMMGEGGFVRDVHDKPFIPGFGGRTFYFRGDSGGEYYITHLDFSSPIKAGRLEAGVIFGYTVKSAADAKLIHGAHIHCGCSKYTGLFCGVIGG